MEGDKQLVEVSPRLLIAAGERDEVNFGGRRPRHGRLDDLCRERGEVVRAFSAHGAWHEPAMPRHRQASWIGPIACYPHTHQPGDLRRFEHPLPQYRPDAPISGRTI